MSNELTYCDISGYHSMWSLELNETDFKDQPQYRDFNTWLRAILDLRDEYNGKNTKQSARDGDVDAVPNDRK